MLTDCFGEYDQLVFIELRRVQRCAHGRDIHGGNVPTCILENRDQLASAVRGNGGNDQGVLRDIELRIDQPAERGTAERIGITGRQLIRPVRCTETTPEYIKGLKTPTYIGCTQTEYPYVQELSAGIEASKFVVYKPESGNGKHGVETLWWDSDTREECWLSLMFFLKDF